MFKNIIKNNPIRIYIQLVVVLLICSYKVFSQITQIPETPKLISPANGSINVSPNVEFIWSESKNADYYILIIWETRFWGGDLIIVRDSIIGDTSVSVPNLKFNKEYKWSVCAGNSTGTSPFTPKWIFKTHINDAPKIVVPLKGESRIGDTQTISFGVARGATYCIDEEFGEYEIPVLAPPSDIFELRFIDTRIRDGKCLGEGIYLDLRSWEKVSKMDTFRVVMQYNYTFLPIIFSWPKNLSRFFDTLFIRVGGVGSTTVDMITNTSFVIDTEIVAFRIFAVPKKYTVPQPPSLLSPDDNAFILDTLKLEWEPTLCAYKYWLQLSPDLDFNNLIINDSSLKITNFQITSKISYNQKYYWRVGAINSEGFSGFSEVRSFTFVQTANKEKCLISEFHISQNYPNPYNSSTKLNYQVPREAYVVIKIYNVLGIEVTTLVNKRTKPGSYEVEFIARSLSSGVYYYSFYIEEVASGKKNMIVKKMCLIK